MCRERHRAILRSKRYFAIQLKGCKNITSIVKVRGGIELEVDNEDKNS
jgi:hypothetical protein